jgi:hypothetical protein
MHLGFLVDGFVHYDEQPLAGECMNVVVQVGVTARRLARLWREA